MGYHELKNLVLQMSYLEDEIFLVNYLWLIESYFNMVSLP